MLLTYARITHNNRDKEFMYLLKFGGDMRKAGWIAVVLVVVLAGCGGGGSGTGGNGSTPSSVKVTTDFPLLLDGGKVLPTYLSSIIGSNSHDLAIITVQNSGGPLTAQVSIDLPDYGTQRTQTVSFAAGETKKIPLSPNFTFSKLFTNTTNVPGAVNVTVTSGTTTLFSQSYPIQITGRNTVFWMNGTSPFYPFIAVMVTPHDKAGSIPNLLSSAARLFADGSSMGGYQVANWPTTSYSVAPGISQHQQEKFYLLSGESPSVFIDSVTVLGVADNNFSVFILDDANYNKWNSGQAAVGCAQDSAATAGAVLQCGPQPTAGWYHVVYSNPASNFASRTVTRHRPMTKWETTYYQAKAIFDELRARGLVYVNLTGGTSFFAVSQNVLYPAEALQNNSSNCIDGSLLFASAFEALGMEPIIAIGPDHAFSAVRCWSGSNDCVIPIETTMIGGTSTFDEAYSAAANRWNTWLTGGQLKQVDIKAMRTVGITPAPM